jgi:hypothetical protein
MDRYIVVRRYASIFLSSGEAEALRRRAKDDYYRFLAGSVLKARPLGFWRYHRNGLRTIGEDLEWLVLLPRLVRKLVWLAINPGFTISLALTQGKASVTHRWRALSRDVARGRQDVRRKPQGDEQASRPLL